MIKRFHINILRLPFVRNTAFNLMDFYNILLGALDLYFIIDNLNGS